MDPTWSWTQVYCASHGALLTCYLESFGSEIMTDVVWAALLRIIFCGKKGNRLLFPCETSGMIHCYAGVKPLWGELMKGQVVKVKPTLTPPVTFSCR